MRLNLFFIFLLSGQLLLSQPFTEVVDTPFDGVGFSFVSFSDVDGDNDQDVLISGFSNPGMQITKLYTNDGSGTFTEAEGSFFYGVDRSSGAFSDIDGDNDMDVLISGLTNSRPVTKLYTNDGLGNFIEVADTPFYDVYVGSAAFSDIDGDNDQDVLITGRDSSDARRSDLFINDGFGNFTELNTVSFEGVDFAAIAFSDVDGDNDEDVLITGRDSSNEFISKLYINNSIVSSISDLTGLSNFKFTLFPNPTKADKLNIYYDSQKNTQVKVVIYDLAGRLIKDYKEQLEIGEHSFSINISSLKKGCYIIQLEDGLKRRTRKIIVD